MGPFLQQFVSAPKSMWKGYSSDVMPTLLKTRSLSSPLSLGRTRSSLGQVRLSLEYLLRDTILNSIMCHLKVTVSPCFYLNLPPLLLLLVKKLIEVCGEKSLK